MGPRPKIATVERREGSRSHRDRSAPRKRGRRASQARQNERVRLSALHPPLIQGPDRPLSPRRWAQARRSVSQAGGEAATSEGTKENRQGKNPHADMRRGNEECCAAQAAKRAV